MLKYLLGSSLRYKMEEITMGELLRFPPMFLMNEGKQMHLISLIFSHLVPLVYIFCQIYHYFIYFHIFLKFWHNKSSSIHFITSVVLFINRVNPLVNPLCQLDIFGPLAFKMLLFLDLIFRLHIDQWYWLFLDDLTIEIILIYFLY